MQVHVRGWNIEVTGALRVHVGRRLAFALSRFGQRSGRVLVRLVDVNGPRGGDDKQCRLDVSLIPSGNVLVEDVDADMYAAIDRATGRAARSVVRELQRERERWPPRPMPTPASPVGGAMIREGGRGT